MDITIPSIASATSSKHTIQDAEHPSSKRSKVATPEASTHDRQSPSSLETASPSTELQVVSLGTALTRLTPQSENEDAGSEPQGHTNPFMKYGFEVPEVKAYYRQSLCEALPYFKAFQSSAYISRGYVRGALLDAECRLRDVLGAQVIMTTM
jgi:hypothetical protein